MPDDRGPERRPLGSEISREPHKNQSPPPGSLAALTARQLTESAELVEQIQDITTSIAETIGAKLLGLELEARCMAQAAADGEPARAAVWRVELTDNVDEARRLVDRLIESTRSNRARSRIRAAVVNLEAGNLVDGPGVRQAALLVQDVGGDRRRPPRRVIRRRTVAAIAGGTAIAGAAGAWNGGASAAVSAIAGALLSAIAIVAAALTSAPGEWR